MTTTVEPSRTTAADGRECRTAARREGAVPALRRLNAALAPDGPPRGPTGHALTPDDAVPVPGGEGTVPGLALSRPEAGAGPSPAWRLALAWLRLGASERLRDQTVARLAERRTEGSPLLMKQLVKGALADALTEHLEAECVLAGLEEATGGEWPGGGRGQALRAGGAGDGDAPRAARPGGARGQADPAAGRAEDAPGQARYGPGAAEGEPAGAWLGHVHERITRADRALLRLLGAHGFVVPGPGWDAHLSELLADVYREGRGVTSEEA